MSIRGLTLGLTEVCLCPDVSGIASEAGKVMYIMFIHSCISHRVFNLSEQE